jgi:hypothetical protein
MKKRATQLNKAHSATQKDWYTFDEVFEQDLKNKAFKKGYEEEMTRIELARKLRTIRLAKNLTQKAVASRADMPQSVIARLESGQHSVSLDTLSRVAYALGKKIDFS